MKIVARKYSILYVVNIPAPYRVDFFNALGEYVDLTVAFEGKNATDRDDKWVGRNIDSFRAVFLKGVRTRSEAFFCPGIIRLLLKKWDLIVLGGYSTPTLALAIECLRILKKQFVIEIDGAINTKEDRIKALIKRHLIQAPEYWLCTGNIPKEYLVKYGANPDKCFIYPFSSVHNNEILYFDVDNPLNYSQKRNERRKIARQKLGISDTEYIILAVGQIIHRKGYDVLLKAMVSVKEKCKIIIIGGKPTVELKNLISSLKLSNIQFVDFLPKNELGVYFESADLFVHPCREDIWGLVINEALAKGLPVISTNRCIAAIELIDDRIGMIVESNDSEELSRAIKIMMHYTAEKDMSFYAKEKAKGYTIETMVERHLKLLDKIISENSR